MTLFFLMSRKQLPFSAQLCLHEAVEGYAELVLLLALMISVGVTGLLWFNDPCMDQVRKGLEN